VKFSESWLLDSVDILINSADLIEKLTMAGLEVEESVPVAGNFNNVVVAEIIETYVHPKANKLQICTVNDGTELLQIVCGASNARAGIKVPLAKIGAKLPNNIAIKQAKLREIDSYGMLCSGFELQINDDSSGLFELPNNANVGQDLRTYLALDDNCIELSITPNRGDCLSILGLTREVSAIFGKSYKWQPTYKVPHNIEAVMQANVENKSSCPRYCGRVIENIDLTKQVPIYIKERLRRSGIRSINLAVDITNYVMLELGQPMHAFDLSQINGGITVRNAKSNEQLKLLDGKTVNLDEDILVIADDIKPIAIAGVMGGEYSGVSDKTSNLFLESAFFTPLALSGKVRNLGLHTDSSYRYERGVDPAITKIALERATQLLLEFGGGKAGRIIEQLSEQHLPKINNINLRLERVSKILGLEIEDSKIYQILNSLNFTVNKIKANEWQVIVPSSRFDIALEIDLIEEVARIYGYANMPAKYPTLALVPSAQSESKISINQIRDILIGREYQEVITYSFISHDLAKIFAQDIQPLKISNPISQEMAVMRPNLWAGLFKAAQYNLKRQYTRIKMFEIGLKFTGDLDNLMQTEVISGIAIGNKHAESWMQSRGKFDFYDIKSDVELLLNLGGKGYEYEFIKSEHSTLHPGQSAKIIKNGCEVGWVGAIHPKLAKKLDINQQLLVFELNFADICTGILPKFKGLSKFPVIRRDLALVVPVEIEYQDLINTIKEQAGNNLIDICLFDVYQGENIATDKRSLAIGLTFQHQDKTLTDTEISEILNNIVVVCADRFNSYLRI